MSRKKNKLFVERMKATREIKPNVTTKKEEQPKKVEEINPKMKNGSIYVESEEKTETKVSNNKIESQHIEIQRKPKHKKSFNILTEKFYERRCAQMADQKRKDKYLKAVYKIMEKGHEEDFDR